MARSSKYLSIWNTLKSKKQITLTIVPGLETRIIKALNERKQYDTVFQFETREDKQKYRVRHILSDNGRIMTITLYRSIGDHEI